MTDLRPPEPAMPERVPSLDKASDEELRALIESASGILKERENERLRDAVARIKALAKEHGLGVSIDTPARKRGRPPANSGRSTPRSTQPRGTSHD